MTLIFLTKISVLLGVNEGIPKFSEFVHSLKVHPSNIEVELYTHELSNFKKRATSFCKHFFLGKKTNLVNVKTTVNDDLMKWDLLKDGKMLSNQSGSLAMKIRLKKPWPVKATTQKQSKLSPKQYAEWLTSKSEPVAKIASFMPDRFINLPFPGKDSLKFELLNGWRVRKQFDLSRKAYKRGRWFLKKILS